ncbi:hypothetical protein EDB81DRAFT_884452 [Dactylonectria macrodidyma]|uniref:Uncharacterized protein n=1 Tax=Dactylonectria macrodidyma TaxID=307937 RepID=A0A9P9EPA3_9HYPO|nr:hypothetical protein EDB81DRAFT_884452 [Dactylonectria macrodidyma]
MPAKLPSTSGSLPIQEIPKSRWDRILDDFFGIAKRPDNDGTYKSDDDSVSMDTSATPSPCVSFVDGCQMAQPTANETTDDLLSLDAISQQPQLSEAACDSSSLPERGVPSTQDAPKALPSSEIQHVVQRMEALEARMTHNAPDLLNRRIEALERKLGSDTSVSLVQRVSTVAAEREHKDLVEIERRFKTLERTMASESSTALVQRLAAMEKNDQVQTSDNKKFQARLDQISVRLDNMTTRLESLASSASLKQRLITVEGHNTDSAARIQRHEARLDKMNNLIDTAQGRVDAMEQLCAQAARPRSRRRGGSRDSTAISMEECRQQ